MIFRISAMQAVTLRRLRPLHYERQVNDGSLSWLRQPLETVESPDTQIAVETTGTVATSTPQTVANAGLHLGQLVQGNLSIPQAQSLANALGGGLDADDIQNMTLGEVLHTLKAAGYSTRQVVELLQAA